VLIRNTTDRNDFITKCLKVDLDKQVWKFTAEPYQPGKSDEQRGLFHVLCRQLGQEVGLTEGEIKDMVKSKMFGTKPVIKWGMTLIVPDSPSTERLSKRVYTELIEVLYMLAAEACVHLDEKEGGL